MPPLYELLRPASFDDMIGQEELVGKGGIIKAFFENKKIQNMILWGPPASGKTTIAGILGTCNGYNFESLSAVMSGKEELKHILKKIEHSTKQTILFVDEIHRWNKSQQDALLPHIEKGTLILIGATTENPSFGIINALLSRVQVIICKPLTTTHIIQLLLKGFNYLYKRNPTQEEHKLLEHIAQNSDRDVRYALNCLESCHSINIERLDNSLVQSFITRPLSYDKNGDEHYTMISALHKSLRSSNASAGLYWAVRMLEGGEDPLYIIRRLIRFASEDIGNANPNALLLANQAHYSVSNIGMPESDVIIAQLIEYLARSPKNNSAYKAYKLAKRDVKKHGSLPVPLHFRNSVSQLTQDLGYGYGYEYDHNLNSKKSHQECFPPELSGTDYYK